MLCKRRRISAPLTVILTISLAILFPMGVVWITSLVETLLGERPQNTHYSIAVLADGTVLKQHQDHRDGYTFRECADLDGNPRELTSSDEMLSQFELVAQTEPRPVQYYSAAPQRTLMMSFFGKEKVPRCWYVIIDNHEKPTGYFVSYDPENGQLLDYLGTSGFSSSRPRKGEQFPLNDLPSSYYYDFFQKQFLLAPTSEGLSLSYGRYPYVPRVNQELRLQFGTLFDHSGLLLTSDRTVNEINLLTGAVTPFAADEKVISFTAVSLNQRQMEVGADPREKATTSGILMRTADELLWRNLEKDTTISITIPERLRTENFYLAFLPNRQLLYMVFRFDRNSPDASTDLYWAGYDGRISRELPAAVANPNGFLFMKRNLKHVQWFTAIAQPAPLSYTAAMLAGPLPLARILYGTTTAETLALLFRMSIGYTIGLTVLACLLLWRYRVRRKRQGANVLWWENVLILLMGPFAYVVLRLNPSLQLDLPAPESLRSTIDVIRVGQRAVSQ